MFKTIRNLISHTIDFISETASRISSAVSDWWWNWRKPVLNITSLVLITTVVSTISFVRNTFFAALVVGLVWLITPTFSFLTVTLLFGAICTLLCFPGTVNAVFAAIDQGKFDLIMVD